MKLNHDCIRDILLFLEENLKFNEYINLLDLSKNLNQYEIDDIKYSLLKLDECNYLTLHSINADNEIMIECIIMDITIFGHEFLDTIRPETVWTQVKETSKKIGFQSLKAILQISTPLISEYLKNIIK